MRLGLQVNHGCFCGESIAIAAQLKLQNMCRMQQTLRLVRAPHAFVLNGCQGDQQEFRLTFGLVGKLLRHVMQNTLADVLQVYSALNWKNCQADVRRPRVFINWPPQKSAGGKDYKRRDGNPGPEVYGLTVKNSKNLFGGRSFFGAGFKAGPDSISPNAGRMRDELGGGKKQRGVTISCCRNWLCPSHNFMENHAQGVNV